ncbi:hypothetical protein GCM10027280_57800 [Micromonospora polyrhachis]
MTSVTTTDRPAGWRARIRTSRVGTLAVLAVTTVLVMGAAYLVDRPDPDADGVTAVELTGAASGPPPAVGKPAQDFTATTVDGQPVSLSEHKGKPIWLTFGASWCAPCRAEAPDIQAAYDQAKANGVVVIAVYLSEDAKDVRDYAIRLGLDFLHVADPETRIASAYRVMGIPTHYFINRAGELHSIKVGVLNRARMDAALAEISK